MVIRIILMDVSCDTFEAIGANIQYCSTSLTFVAHILSHSQSESQGIYAPRYSVQIYSKFKQGPDEYYIFNLNIRQEDTRPSLKGQGIRKCFHRVSENIRCIFKQVQSLLKVHLQDIEVSAQTQNEANLVYLVVVCTNSRRPDLV